MTDKHTWRDLTPQQQKFLSAYLDPNSPTWSDAKNSAISAGYEELYAENLTHQMPIWLSDALQDTALVDKALNNLSVLLGDEDKRIQADMTKFTLTRLAKKKFGDSVDITSKGEAIKGINYIVPDNDKADS